MTVLNTIFYKEYATFTHEIYKKKKKNKKRKHKGLPDYFILVGKCKPLKWVMVTGRVFSVVITFRYLKLCRDDQT